MFDTAWRLVLCREEKYREDGDDHGSKYSANHYMYSTKWYSSIIPIIWIYWIIVFTRDNEVWRWIATESEIFFLLSWFLKMSKTKKRGKYYLEVLWNFSYK